MLLRIYTQRDFTIGLEMLLLSLVLTAIVMLLARGAAALFGPSEHEQEEEFARQERIKAQSRERRADRR